MIELLIYPLLIGVFLTLITGPLGTFMIWKRMAFFGDTVAHGALLGVAFGVLLSINLTVAIVISAILSAIALAALRFNRTLPTDTLLGLISHGSLALGLMALGLLANQRINLVSLLLGDILTVSGEDLLLIVALTLVGLLVLATYWRPLLMCTIDEDLAKVEGHNTRKLNVILTVLMAVTIAIAVKIVGVLLITALMIIPAATSRLVSKSPEAMALIAALLGATASCVGLIGSGFMAVPAGPAIVSTSLLIFLLVLSFQQKPHSQH